MALSAVYDAMLHLYRTRYYNQIVKKASEHDQEIPQSHWRPTHTIVKSYDKMIETLTV